ncbi:MAG: MCE family protein [Desulfobacteraceae bacterium]|nr:MAG: MCE family protein [Desulfobacteraceae bacterium]
MASQKTKFAVGLFILSGLMILTLAVIWLGVTRFLEKGDYYITYFDESVQGLEKDSPVKYRGVAIGRVEKIRVAPDARLIEVLLKIDSGQNLESDVVSQLKAVGITGSMFVELDRRKPGEPDRSPLLNFPSEYKIIASRPSEITGIMGGIGEAIDRIKSLDLGGISEKVKRALDHIDQAIADVQIKKLSSGFQSSIQGLNQIIYSPRWGQIMDSTAEATHTLNTVMVKAENSFNRIEKAMSTIEGITTEKEQTIKSAIDDFRKAMANANSLMERSHSMVQNTDEAVWQLSHDLLVISRNLEKASINLNRLIDSVAAQPSQLFLGEPPVEKKVDPEVSQFP